MNIVEKARLFAGPTKIPLSWNPIHNASDCEMLQTLVAKQVQSLEVLYIGNGIRICANLLSDSFATGRMLSRPYADDAHKEYASIYRICMVELAAMLYDHEVKKYESQNAQSEV